MSSAASQTYRARADISNLEGTQRCVDVIFKALKAIAQSHGTMNYTHLMYKDYTWAETSEFSPASLLETRTLLTRQSVVDRALAPAGTERPASTST